MEVLQTFKLTRSQIKNKILKVFVYEEAKIDSLIDLPHRESVTLWKSNLAICISKIDEQVMCEFQVACSCTLLYYLCDKLLDQLLKLFANIQCSMKSEHLV